MGSGSDTEFRGKKAKRKKWTEYENNLVLDCYDKSMSNEGGYRKRMLEFWMLESGGHNLNEQQLLCQLKFLITKQKKINKRIRHLVPNQKEQSETTSEPEETGRDEISTDEYTPDNYIDNDMKMRIIENMKVKMEGRTTLQVPRTVGKAKLINEVEGVKDILSHIEATTVTEINNLEVLRNVNFATSPTNITKTKRKTTMGTMHRSIRKVEDVDNISDSYQRNPKITQKLFKNGNEKMKN